jgi:delta24(24(1))-sterol reductase
MDISMAQKSHFKAVKTGTYIKRNTFPQLPWAELDNPHTFKTKKGELLLDGCWKYLRKPSMSRKSLLLRSR